MEEYEIILTPDALEDLTELRDYIANVLLSPNAAFDYLHSVRKTIASLSQLPARYRLLDEEPWHSRGVRRIIAKNYYVYYSIDQAAKKVYVMNVIYSRRDQLHALSEKE